MTSLLKDAVGVFATFDKPPAEINPERVYVEVDNRVLFRPALANPPLVAWNERQWVVEAAYTAAGKTECVLQLRASESPAFNEIEGREVTAQYAWVYAHPNPDPDPNADPDPNSRSDSRSQSRRRLVALEQEGQCPTTTDRSR